MLERITEARERKRIPSSTVAEAMFGLTGKKKWKSYRFSVEWFGFFVTK